MGSTGGTAAETERCRARTEDGERCSRPAREDGFCYQHDADDPTATEAESQAADGGGTAADGDGDGTRDRSRADGGDGAGGDGAGGDDAAATADPDATADDDGGSAGSDGEPTSGGGDTDAASAEGGDTGSDDAPAILEVRQAVESAAEEIIGRPLDGVLEVSPDEEVGWRVEVEVVERAAVPDTQDILGRYEVHVGDEARVRGYRRLERYRRGDTSQSEPSGR